MSEHAAIEEKIQEVKDQLERLGGQLAVLSTTIWQGIDHDNQDRLKEGVRFKQTYNERRHLLEAAMGEMLVLLNQYSTSGSIADVAAPRGEAEEPEAVEVPEQPQVAEDTGESVAASPQASGLDEKVPFGFILSGKTFTSASSWPLFYEALLQELHGREPEKLTRLADVSGEFEQGGRPLFARVPDTLDDPLPIADSIFAEANLAPPALLQVIKRLISHMGYPLDSFKILLKEKNRGTVETLSLAA
jgi:hypothetical protein